MSDFSILRLMVAQIDPHTCSAARLRRVTQNVQQYAREHSTRLSDRAAAGALMSKLQSYAKSRNEDPIPFHAIEERMR